MKINPTPLLTIFGVIALSSSNAAWSDSIIGNIPPSERERLSSMGETEIPMRNVPLNVAINLAAESAGMSYIAPTPSEFSEEITLRVNDSPYRILQLLAQTYGFDIQYDDGVWSFHRTDSGVLIARKYDLRYNTYDGYEITAPTINSQALGGEGGGGGNSEGLSGGSSVFEQGENPLIEQIESILGLRAGTNQEGVQNAGSVDQFSRIDSKSVRPDKNANDGVQGKVVYLPESTSIIVWATRQQHQFIETLLAESDKPQRMVKIQSKIIETSLNPESMIGVDWSNVTGNQGFSLSGLETEPFDLNDIESGFSVVEDLRRVVRPSDLENGEIFNSNPFVSRDATSTLSAVQADGRLRFPTAAILSADSLIYSLNFLANDNESTLAQDPVVVTANNRRVSLKSVILEPIQTSSDTQVSASAQTVSVEIEYLEIGTVIDILPQILDSSIAHADQEAIKLFVSIVISNTIGDRLIAGISFPVISSRTYNFAVVVPDTYSLAVGGLTETVENDNTTKLPFFGDLPIAGKLFSSRSSDETRRNLMAFITPEIINDKNGTLRDYHEPNFDDYELPKRRLEDLFENPEGYFSDSE